MNLCLCIQSYPCSLSLILFLLNQPCRVFITLQPQKKHFDLPPILFLHFRSPRVIILLSGINGVKSSSLYIHHRMTLQYSSTPTCCIFSHPAILKILLHPWFILFFKALLSLYFFQPSALLFYLKKKCCLGTLVPVFSEKHKGIVNINVYAITLFVHFCLISRHTP